MSAKKILVAMDGSKPAMRALEFAATNHAAPLLVLNVQPAMPSSRFVSRSMIADHHRRAADEALARARRLIERRGLDAQVLTAVGDPAETLIRLAKKHRCGVIVMGCRGQGPVASLLLGSVASKVIQTAACPVTVVK
jgi:nucleotide-binding universal stress UspA family protein